MRKALFGDIADPHGWGVDVAATAEARPLTETAVVPFSRTMTGKLASEMRCRIRRIRSGLEIFSRFSFIAFRCLRRSVNDR